MKSLRQNFSTSKVFSEKMAGDQLSVKEVLDIEDDEVYLKRFAGSPLMRAKREGLQRNMRILDGN